jgi:ribonuclease HI
LPPLERQEATARILFSHDSGPLTLATLSVPRRTYLVEVQRTAIATRMIEVYTDGRAEPNPGLGTYGFVVYRDGERIQSDHGLAGRKVTNNYAEYFCLVKALEHLRPYGGEVITVFSDSTLLVNQMNGKWKFKKGAYSEKYLEAKRLASTFLKLRFEWIPRERNTEADELTNVAFAQAAGRKA